MDSSAAMRAPTELLSRWLLATAGVVMTLFFVALPFTGRAATLPAGLIAAAAGTAALAWAGVLLHGRLGRGWIWVVATAAVGVHAILPTLHHGYGGTVMALFMILLLWTSPVTPVIWNVLLAAYITACAHAAGATWVLHTIDMDAPGKLSIHVMAACSILPVGFGAAMQLMLRRAVARLEAELQTAEREHMELTDRLRRNATELEASQAQLLQAQRLQTVGTMASGLAHELNNILTPVRGLAELLAAGVGPESSQRYGQRILDSAVAAAQITGALLTYTRQGTFQPLRSNARQLLQGQILPVLSKSLPRGVWLRVDLARNVSLDVDRVLFQQAITNLVFNAVDAMPDGGEIRIGLATSSRPCGADPDPGDGIARSAEITVHDSGVGIPPEHLDRIFDPFFTTKGVGAGTGLGLAMVQGAIDRHGGSVEVESTRGQGTTFTLRFPLASSDGHVGARLGLLTAEPAGPVVVIVTEDDDQLDEFEELLAATECTPLCTTDARAAQTLLAEMGDKVALLILDLDIQALDAKAMFRSLRESLPELPVMLTATEPIGPVVQRMIGAGPTRPLRKPVDPQVLLRTLTEFLHPQTTYAGDVTPTPDADGWPEPSSAG
jgi:signal transduction histidine kinase/CheY-like chemotaxis protein